MTQKMIDWLASAPDWIQGLPEALQSFCYNIFRHFIQDDRYKYFLSGLGNTLLLTLFALIIGVCLGVVVSLIRVTYDKQYHEMRSGPGKVFLKIGNAICNIYLTVIRGTPAIVQIMIMFFVIFASSRNKLAVGCLAFGINSGAYVAEIIRGGIMSVDIGQTEAGRSLGFGYVPTMRFIVLPQAFKTVLPSLVNEFIVLLKETAVAGYIGLTDLTYAANIVGGRTYNYFYPLITAALIYLLLVTIITFFMKKLERRLQNSEGRGNKRLQSVHRGVTRSLEEVVEK